MHACAHATVSMSVSFTPLSMVSAAGAEPVSTPCVAFAAMESAYLPGFVAAVSPRWAIVPVGYRSRFGHPHPQVLERYREAGARIARTDLDGAIRIKLGELEVRREREIRARYWLE